MDGFFRVTVTEFLMCLALGLHVTLRRMRGGL